MKITIDNRSKIPDHEILLCVDELIQKEKDYMEKNAQWGCRFEFKSKGFCIAMLREKKGGLGFLVVDMKETDWWMKEEDASISEKIKEPTNE